MWAFSWKQCWGGWKGQRYGVPPQAFLGLSSSHWLTFKNKEFDRTLEGMHNVIGWCYESPTRLVGKWNSLWVMHYYLNSTNIALNLLSSRTYSTMKWLCLDLPSGARQGWINPHPLGMCDYNRMWHFRKSRNQMDQGSSHWARWWLLYYGSFIDYDQILDKMVSLGSIVEHLVHQESLACRTPTLFKSVG